jgi:hypothetical protein
MVTVEGMRREDGLERMNGSVLIVLCSLPEVTEEHHVYRSLCCRDLNQVLPEKECYQAMHCDDGLGDVRLIKAMCYVRVTVLECELLITMFVINPLTPTDL